MRAISLAGLLALGGCAFAVHDPVEQTTVMAKCYTGFFQAFCIPLFGDKAVGGHPPMEMLGNAAGTIVIGAARSTTTTTVTTAAPSPAAPAPSPSGGKKK